MCTQMQNRLLEDSPKHPTSAKAVMTGYGMPPNIMFLELFPETLKKLTFPNGNTCFPLGKDRVPNLETPIAPEGNTITKNTTEITTNINKPIPSHYPKGLKVNHFCNFPKRTDYDFEELEKKLIKN